MPNQKGAIAEAAVALAALELGVGVYRPVSEHNRCDLVFDVGGRLQRVQVKTARKIADVVSINLVGCRHTPNGYVRRRYMPDEVDLFAAYCHETRIAYLFPFALVSGQGSIQLRLTAPRNNQRAAIHFASEFELPGAVAQLEVALAWHARGRRFESGQLHSPLAAESQVGANEFRQRFGRYMERAAAGETFHVTRRGKPYVTLGPGGESQSRTRSSTSPTMRRWTNRP
jgi:prevent-host-death family protein